MSEGMQCGLVKRSERKGWATAELPMCHSSPEEQVKLETS